MGQAKPLSRPPIQSRERSRSLYHRRRVLHTSSGPPLLSSRGTDRAVRKHRHMFAKREGTEVVSQCHVGRSAHPVDCHHLARRLDDDQVLELEDMFDQATCRLSWGPRDCRSVHRSVEMASRGHFGAFVYTVGPWAWVVGGLGIAIVYTNGRIGPLRTGLGRLCTLLDCCAVVDKRGDAGVYTNQREQGILMVLLRFVYTIVPLGAPRGRPPLRTAPITSL